MYLHEEDAFGHTLDILHTKLCFTYVNVTLAHIAICFWMYTPSQTPAMIS